MREYYAYALIAGISISDAKRLTPGFVQDMYTIRVKYDQKMNGLMGNVKEKSKGGPNSGGKRKRH